MRLERKKQVIRDTAKHLDQTLFTTWFETQSDETLIEPPSLHPDCKVTLGDLFLHLHADGAQIWLRVQDNDSKPSWKAIDVGYEREDGCHLTLTPKMQVLSWVGKSWGDKCILASEYHSRRCLFEPYG